MPPVVVPRTIDAQATGAAHQYRDGAGGELDLGAEPVAACASVYRTTQTFVEVSQVGTPDRPPRLRPDGTTTGHMVVWTSTFARLVDATLVQDPTLLALAHTDAVYSMPVLARAPAQRTQLWRAELGILLTDDLHVTWLLQPQWTDLANQVLVGDLQTAAVHGALGLATDALRVITGLGEDRDLGELSTLYPTLAALLTGDAELPPMPSPPGEDAPPS